MTETPLNPTPALVTIGIPCFNSARWLRECIESALAQTWPKIEIIVVDDGSTDDSRAIAQSFANRIRFIPADHEGATSARNVILKEAHGEWIQFLDADDVLLPDKIARQMEEADAGRNADVIYSPVLIETATGRAPSQIALQNNLFAQWLAWQLPQTGGALWRRSALETLGGWKRGQPCCQEHELYLRALKAGLRFVFAPTAGAIYRIWSDDTLCRKDPRLVVRVKAALIDGMMEWLKGSGICTELHRRIAGQACFEMARTLAKIDLGEAVAYHRERHSRGLIHLGGPAAPGAYRLAYATLGFALAERLARASR